MGKKYIVTRHAATAEYLKSRGWQDAEVHLRASFSLMEKLKDTDKVGGNIPLHLLKEIKANIIYYEVGFHNVPKEARKHHDFGKDIVEKCLFVDTFFVGWRHVPSGPAWLKRWSMRYGGKLPLYQGRKHDYKPT